MPYQVSPRLQPLRWSALQSIDIGRWVSRPCLGVMDIALALFVGSAAFWLLLVMPMPLPTLGELDLWLTRGALAALFLGALVAAIDRHPPPFTLRLLSIGATVVCLTAFALPLAIHWHHGTTNGGVIGALIPYNDAAGYMAGTWHLLAEGELNHWNMRRPINAAMHALRWMLAGGDMAISFGLMAWWIGLASLLATALLRRDLGWSAAAVFAIAWLLYAEEWLPMTLSEAHGCFLGVLGFAFTWQAGRDRSAFAFGLGMAFVSLALAARAGPFFLLPAFLVWGVLYLGSDWRARALQAAAGLIGAGVGQGLPKLYNALWGDGVNSLYSNFSYTLYGMTAGGKQWNVVYEERPEIFQSGLGESTALAENIYQAALDNFLADPGLLFGFLLQELKRFPSFLTDWPMLPATHGDFWFGLLVVGCLGLLVTWRRAHSGLLLAGLAGLWLSSPFLMLDGGHRVFAPGNPWLFGVLAFGVFAAISAAVGVVEILRSIAAPGGGRTADEDPIVPRGAWPAGRVVAALGVVLLLAVASGPMLAIPLYPRVEAEPTGRCESGEIERVVRPARSSIILQARPEGVPSPPGSSEVRHPGYFADMPLHLIPFMQAVSKLEAPYTLMQVYDMVAGDAGRQTSVHAVRRRDVPPLPEDGVVSLCGRDLCENCYLYDIRSWQRIRDD